MTGDDRMLNVPFRSGKFYLLIMILSLYALKIQAEKTNWPELHLLFSETFDKEKIPEIFKISKHGGKSDWEKRNGTICRSNIRGASNIKFGWKDWNIAMIELKFKMLGKQEKQDSMFYLNYGGSDIRVSFGTNRISWFDGKLFKKDKKAGSHSIPKNLNPNKWHILKVFYLDNGPSVFIDGNYILTGRPFSKEKGIFTLGCWMLACAFDDIKIYAANENLSSTYSWKDFFKELSVNGISNE